MKLKVSLMIVAFFLSFAFSYGQKQESGDRYVFVISKINYLKAIEDAISSSGTAGLNISEASVILCGESVQALPENHPLIGQALANERIKLYACGLSLEQMKIDPKLYRLKYRRSGTGCWKLWY